MSGAEPAAAHAIAALNPLKTLWSRHPQRFNLEGLLLIDPLRDAKPSSIGQPGDSSKVLWLELQQRCRWSRLDLGTVSIERHVLRLPGSQQLNPSQGRILCCRRPSPKFPDQHQMIETIRRIPQQHEAMASISVQEAKFCIQSRPG